METRNWLEGLRLYLKYGGKGRQNAAWSKEQKNIINRAIQRAKYGY